MAEERTSLADLKDALAGAQQTGDGESGDGIPGLSEGIFVEPTIDAFGRSYGTGRRKDAVARVWIKPGVGKFSINGRTLDDYFARPTLRQIIVQPFNTTNRMDQFDIFCTVSGGGLSGQAGAVRHGISRALVNFEPGLRPALKHAGFMTRDSRVVERKKYGKAKARRSFQFSKR
tara:strand:- start:153 stop:674 length:522 start_codon:yes stop_codon:yes gene_type:complete